MIELNKQEFKKVIPMIQKADFNIMFAMSVLEGKVDGVVYADDEVAPTSVYIQHPYGMALLYGVTNKKEFYEQLVPHFLNIENKRNKFEWLQVYPATLYGVMDDILGDKLIKKEPNDSNYIPEEYNKVLEYQRINFSFQKNKYISMKQGLNNKNINNKDINNIYLNKKKFKIIQTSEIFFNELNESVVPKFFWNNYNNFIENGIGYTLLSDSGVPVSTAFASFTDETKLEIGIETNKEYLGSGFATLVCSRLIDYCMEKGYEPVWSCNSANPGSRNLAHKLGFEESKRIPYYRLAK